MAHYDSSFFAYVNSGSVVSASNLLPPLLENININSVLDVGCGQGGWLSVWRQLGVNDVLGIDGDYVERSELLIPKELFRPLDLCERFELGRRFDLVQCLEVAEHLSKNSASTLVDSLCAHGNMVLFSAAPPGQGGDHHVNEQPYDYWRELFTHHGYVVCDFVRARIAHNFDVEPWYRYNVFLYVKETHLYDLPSDIHDSLIPFDAPLKDISPWSYKLRKAFVRLFPVILMTWIAKAKERITIVIRSRKTE